MQMATVGRQLPSLSTCLCLSAIVSWPAGTAQVMSCHMAQHTTWQCAASLEGSLVQPGLQ